MPVEPKVELNEQKNSKNFIGKWSCPACTYINAGLEKCEMCETRIPDEVYDKFLNNYTKEVNAKKEKERKDIKKEEKKEEPKKEEKKEEKAVLPAQKVKSVEVKKEDEEEEDEEEEEEEDDEEEPKNANQGKSSNPAATQKTEIKKEEAGDKKAKKK